MGESGDPRKRAQDDERNKTLPNGKQKVGVPPPVLEGFATGMAVAVSETPVGPAPAMVVQMGDLSVRVYMEPGDGLVEVCQALLIANEQALQQARAGGDVVVAKPGDEKAAAQLANLRGD